MFSPLFKWFYAFSIAPNSNEPQARPPNTTKNPFLESAPRLQKRPLEMDGGENFIFGNVQQPMKRSRVGRSSSSILFIRNRSISFQHKVNQENRPRVISVGVVTQRRYVRKSSLDMKKSLNLAQHFINDCPERSKPPENYICKICNEVCQMKSDKISIYVQIVAWAFCSGLSNKRRNRRYWWPETQARIRLSCVWKRRTLS